MVQMTLGIGDAILIASSMSFIGLGAQPPMPEWGAMILLPGSMPLTSGGMLPSPVSLSL